MEQELRTRIGPGRVVLAVVLLPLLGFALWAGLGALWHFPQPVYRLTPMRLGVTLAACGAILAIVRALWREPHPVLTAAILPTACLWVVSFISFIGVVTMPVAIGLTLVLVGVSTRTGAGTGRAAVLSLLAAVALAVLLFADPWTAAVECGASSVSTSERAFSGSNSGSSSGSGTSSAAPDGAHGAPSVMESRGTMTSNGETYVYHCRGGELLEYRRVD